jgi:elongation factor G
MVGYSQAKPAMTDEPPRPLLCEIAIEPKSKADQQRLMDALEQISMADQNVRFQLDQESGQVRLRGLGEENLYSAVYDLQRTYKVEANIGAPQVAYRETLGRRAEIDYTHKKQTGGTGQFAKISLIFEPLPPGSGFVFENEIVGGAIPKEFIPGVEKGLRSVMNSGPLVGFPVIDFKVSLIDGSYHDVDSSVLAFEIAARAAFREAAEKVQMKLLEPIMKVEVVSPEDYVGTVIGDLNSRRGMIQGQEMRGNATVINAQVPLANMFGYVNNLRSQTQGRANYTMQFSHYVPVEPTPPDDVFPPAIGMRA